MTKQASWYLDERALAFASLVLTKSNDVKVQPYVGHDMAIDLLVEILKAGKPTWRLFGVQIVSSLDLPNFSKADERVLSHLGRDSFEASLPLCVFLIGVRKPEGIYRWTVEPVVEKGRGLLQRIEEANWQPLDQTGAARLIAQVNAWYDARNGSTTPQTNGGHLK